jgi:hypothetical protein
VICTFNRTKVAIKMSRASGKTKDLPDEDVPDSDVDSEVEGVASNGPAKRPQTFIGIHLLECTCSLLCPTRTQTNGTVLMVRFGGVS